MFSARCDRGIRSFGLVGQEMLIGKVSSVAAQRMSGLRPVWVADRKRNRFVSLD